MLVLAVLEGREALGEEKAVDALVDLLVAGDETVIVVTVLSWIDPHKVPFPLAFKQSFDNNLPSSVRLLDEL